MKITLFGGNSMRCIHLPDRIQGRYTLQDPLLNAPQECLLRAEADGVHWVLYAGSGETVRGRHTGWETSVMLFPECLYEVKDSRQNTRYYVLTETVTENAQLFKRYAVADKQELSIGRSRSNQICFPNPLVSGKHLLLQYGGGKWSMKDLDSANGTYVNGKRCEQQALEFGDCIFVMGMKIIVGAGFLAVNRPEQVITLLDEYSQGDLTEPILPQWQRLRHFHRSPCFLTGPEPVSVTLEAPPACVSQKNSPLLLTVGPAITMGTASFAMLALTASGEGDPSGRALLMGAVMASSILVSGMLWPAFGLRYEKKRAHREEAERRHSYLAYLDRMMREIAADCEAQEVRLRELYPDTRECRRRAMEDTEALWEREPSGETFLTLRLGTGSIPLLGTIHLPLQRFTVERDVLTEEVYRLFQEPPALKEVPVCCSLKAYRMLGIICPQREKSVAFLQTLVLQLTTLHGYDELKIALWYPQGEEELWKWAGLLPHIWDSGRERRYLASGSEYRILLSDFAEAIANQDGREHPVYYVLAVAGMLPAGAAESVCALLAKERVSVLVLGKSRGDLPRSCDAAAELDGGQGCLYLKDCPKRPQIFRLDEEDDGDDRKTPGIWAVCMANLQLETDQACKALPEAKSIFELFSVDRAGYLNSDVRWSRNRPFLSLKTPIGVGAGGKLMYLDLHEKAHGPHGLIAGMTGSGKSEFLYTLILSLAINFHPHEAAILLIDYKGGGLAGSFEKEGMRLPHLAGTVTNLDGSSVKRALISLQSELTRRQRLFKEAGQRNGEGSVDIYRYQEMVREQLAMEPIPHLFVIADEFAELKTQHPEFMEQLISAARIGRSLGIHLILATQKPSGIVDDQIWSNSRFRICFKVQEKSDSMDVLKTSEAAYLKHAGRFYMQVGMELCEMGQSGWSRCSASRELNRQIRASHCRAVERSGRTVAAYTAGDTAGPATRPTQADAVLEYLADLAVKEKITPICLWQPPLPGVIWMEELAEKYGVRRNTAQKLAPLAGELDDPASQCKRPFFVPLEDSGNVLLYGRPGSGRKTFLHTLIYSMINQYGSKSLHLYLMDLETVGMHCWLDAPQVGGLIGAGQTEKAHALIEMLKKELVYRQNEEDKQERCRIVTLIHSCELLLENFPELEEELVRLFRSGPRYGIYFVMSATGSTVKWGIAQYFPEKYSLLQNEESDYTTVLGSTDGIYPAGFAGRGIVRRERVMEFHTAVFGMRGIDREIEETVWRCQKENEGARAPALKVMPERVDPAYMRGNMPGQGLLPAGVSQAAIKTVGWDAFKYGIMPVCGRDAACIRDFFEALVQTLTGWDGLEVAALSMSGSDAGADERLDTVCGCVAEERVIRRLCLIPDWEAFCAEWKEEQLERMRRSLLSAGKNLSFVIGFTDGLTSVRMEEWYRSRVKKGCGIWLGSGFMEQFLLLPPESRAEWYRPIPDDFGYLLWEGKTSYIKVLHCHTWYSS